jgi:hypothetical protein
LAAWPLPAPDLADAAVYRAMRDGAQNTPPRGAFYVAGRPDEIAKTMVVGVPLASRGVQDTILEPTAGATIVNRPPENSFAVSAPKWR